MNAIYEIGIDKEQKHKRTVSNLIKSYEFIFNKMFEKTNADIYISLKSARNRRQRQALRKIIKDNINYSYVKDFKEISNDYPNTKPTQPCKG